MRPKPKLTDDDTLLRMHHEGHTNEEIAQHFKCSHVAVWKRLRRLLPGPEVEILENSGLTDKQKRFVCARLEGKTATASAAAAYETADPASLKSMGSELLANEKIIDCVNRLMAVHGLTRSRRIFRLRQHLENKDPLVSLKSIDIANRMDDSYPANKNVNINTNIAIGLSDPVKELCERIINRQEPAERERVISEDGINDLGKNIAGKNEGRVIEIGDGNGCKCE